VVAKLTADNLMFVMRLNKAEREVSELIRDKEELKRGLEEQEGPWFDTVLAQSLVC